VSEPIGRNARVLKWIVDGVKNPVCADFHDDFNERLHAKIAAAHRIERDTLAGSYCARRAAG
jgi:hypothetical protein